MNEYFELSDGKSSKFWKIEVKGKSQSVTYGRLGTSGQTRTKQFSSSTEAKEASKKLIESKRKKGYLAKSASKSGSGKTGKKSKNSVAKPGTKSNPRIQVPKLVLQTLLSHFILIYQHGRELWFFDIESEEVDELNQGISLLEYESKYERFQKDQTHVWRFKNANAATLAIKAIKNRAKQDGFYLSVVNKIEFDASRDLSKSDVKLTEKHPRIGQFELSKSGPIEIQIHGAPNWIYPRPPSRCIACGGAMQHVVSARGPIDPESGKKNSGIYVFGCPNATPNSLECVGLMESLYQRSDAKSDSSWYLVNKYRKEFVNLHLVVQSDLAGKQYFGLIQHRGESGIPGEVVSKQFDNLKQARSAAEDRWKYLKIKKGFKDEKDPRMDQKTKPLYRELFEVNRRLIGDPPKRMLEKKLKAKRVIEPYDQLTTSKYSSWSYQYGLSVMGGERRRLDSLDNPTDGTRLAMSLGDQLSSPILSRGQGLDFNIYIDPISTIARVIGNSG